MPEIKYYFVSYTDLFGYQRAKMVPAAAFEGAKANGAGFAGFASWLDLSPADGDLLAMPDMDSLIQLPWKPEIAWVASDLVLDGVPLAQSPRGVLKALTAEAAAQGFEMRSGVEPEFFLLTPAGDAISDPSDAAEKPCYDQSALLRRYEVIAEICDHMQTLGWGPYQNDHEDANGQFEMNWRYDTALRTADKHAFFKFLAKSVAENHGFRVTFMPKPFAHLTGNGCHVHVSGWVPGGDSCLFDDASDEDGLSATGKAFMAGVLDHAQALSAFANPVVNSYKRTQPGTTLSGATWAPNTVTWTGNNRTHMVRIPGPGRFEFRLADGAANPYLLQAALLAAGLDGMARKTALTARTDGNMYDVPPKARTAPKLPTSLDQALTALEADTTFRNAIAPEMASAFLKLKRGEWQAYLAHYSAWEHANAIDI
ncbi:MAG: glutamine synthetase type III [Akkermansiaceae bacterium]|jgi:glutamine synthetase